MASLNWTSILGKLPKVISTGRFHRIHQKTPVYRASCAALNLYQGPGILHMDQSEDISLAPYDIVFFPPNTTRQFTFEAPCVHQVILFSIPSKISMPVLHLPCNREHQILNSFDKILDTNGNEPLRASFVLASLLWELKDLWESTYNRKSSSLVDRAVSMIESNYSSQISVSEIAGELKISHNHLTRLFKKNRGETVTATIQKLRMKAVYSLLKQTDLPLKAIASEVGISDLQRFNKSVKKYFDVSPRVLEKQIRKNI